jgi:GT2 family glycosyltransferase
MKKVAVIIVNYNGQKYLPDLFNSLEKTDYPKDDWQIILVDNKSSDESVQYVKENYSKVKILLQDKNTGFAEGNNIGMNFAISKEFDFVFLLNQDTEVSPNWLKPLVELAEADKSIGAVQSKLFLHSDKTRLNTVGNKIHFLGFGYGEASNIIDDGKYDKVREINYPSGAAVLLRVSALKKIGLFDDTMFMYIEDLDLGWRLWIAGYKCVMQPTSIIYHKYEFDRSMKQVYYFERNRLLTILRNYKAGTLVMILPAWFIMEIAQLLYAAKNHYLGKKIASYFYFTDPQVWIDIGSHRRKQVELRQLTDRQILSKFTGSILFQELGNPLLLYVANPIFTIYLRVMRFIVWW